MRRHALWVVVLSCACSSRAADPPPPPLDQAILGTWDELCVVSEREVTSCTGKDDRSGFIQFTADGNWTSDSGHGDPPITGTWTLHGDQLEQAFVVAGKAGTEAFRVHLEGDQLALWDIPVRFTTVYTRRGKHAALASAKVASGEPVNGTLSGVAYTLPLPAGYRLASDESYRQLWSPPDGQGLFVEIKVVVRQDHSERCDPTARDAGERNTVDGVERDIKIGIDRCAHDTDVFCQVHHSRGYLEPDEVKTGHALCAALSLR